MLGCLSSTCLARQYLSHKITGKKLVNRHCRTNKVTLGDKFLAVSLQQKVGKDNYTASYEPKIAKRKFDKRKQKGQVLSFNSASIVKKPITVAPVEQIKKGKPHRNVR